MKRIGQKRGIAEVSMLCSQGHRAGAHGDLFAPYERVVEPFPTLYDQALTIDQQRRGGDD
jgi:hypothetical protein